MNNLMVVLNGLLFRAQSETSDPTVASGPVLHGLTVGKKEKLR